MTDSPSATSCPQTLPFFIPLRPAKSHPDEGNIPSFFSHYIPCQALKSCFYIGYGDLIDGYRLWPVGASRFGANPSAPELSPEFCDRLFGRHTCKEPMGVNRVGDCASCFHRHVVSRLWQNSRGSPRRNCHFSHQQARHRREWKGRSLEIVPLIQLLLGSVTIWV